MIGLIVFGCAILVFLWTSFNACHYLYKQLFEFNVKPATYDIINALFSIAALITTIYLGIKDRFEFSKTSILIISILIGILFLLIVISSNPFFDKKNDLF